MALTLVSSTPTHGDVDVFINKSITITFDLAINSATLHQGTVNLIDTTTQVAVLSSISKSPTDETTIVITPSVYLREQTLYRVVVVGSDQGLGAQLEAENGELLEESIYIEFTTGNTAFAIDTTVQKDAADKSLEGDLFLPSNLKALGYDFTLEKARPKNHTWNIDPTITGDNTIRFTFSKPLLSGQDFDSWADINIYQTMNNDSYFASGTQMSTGAVPTYNMGVVDNDFLIIFDSELPKNTSVFIELNQNITAADGTEYPGNFQYTFITQTLPKISGPETIKREVRPIAPFYNDDYIVALLFKNSIWLWERLGRRFDVNAFPYAANQYVIYSTVLDLIEDADLSKWTKAGVRRRLGDFAVEVDQYLGKLAIKAAKYEQMKDRAFETLVKGWQFRVGSNSVAYDNAIADISRLWYNVNNRYTDPIYKFYQDDIPGTNVTINRWAKTNNPWW